MGLSDTLRPSLLASNGENWITSPELVRSNLHFEPKIFVSSATHLLANPNLTSGHLFRADILFDSSGILKTPAEKERETASSEDVSVDVHQELAVEPLPAPAFDSFSLTRTILRRFIPRKQKLDPTLDQTCHFYSQTAVMQDQGVKVERCLLIYLPHFSSEEQVPFYHPCVRGLGFLYEFSRPLFGDSDSTSKGTGTLSLHFIPFSHGIPETVPYRLERTCLALLSTHVRLARSPSAKFNTTGSQPKPYKDNIIPQHVVQTTYARLKDKYASILIQNWAEVTEPSKHVFEDIAIAAFLIELWKIMYTQNSCNGQEECEKRKSATSSFPGFVDIACGNGVLVYLLHAEGYKGWGFDARRRKSWEKYPPSTQDRLKESICIPSIFRSAASEQIPDTVETNDGVFEKDTFIISNHADELTIWTPLLGALAQPTSPLPFLAIPCCSHSISGSKYRYPPPKKPSAKSNTERQPNEKHSQDTQPSTGDLKALRATKLAERDDPGLPSSTYGALTAKTVSLAEELGYDVEKTLMRIPSTRNIGIIGGLNTWKASKGNQGNSTGESWDSGEMEDRVRQVVEREAMKDGGLKAAAGIWIDRSLGLHRGQGRGKVKGGEQHG
uniref:tRNA (uracil-O(2)-)-methyltransferase n=1 Tax=Coccidioides posadasii RMSCC 3488 TaxID=454284 RepID=A0A0J6IHI3_COCPO|nr:hypothetical protein CPAG_07594 [Coccidioides posadasii RMSCC 3488]